MAIERIPVVGNLLTRDRDASTSSQDQHFVNCYPEAVDKENLFVVKRPGTQSEFTWTTTGTPRGTYYWDVTGEIYAVVNDKLLSTASTTATLLTLNTTHTDGDVYFTETGGGSPWLVMHDGKDIYVLNSSNVVYQIHDSTTETTAYTQWSATTGISLGFTRIPTTYNGFYYEAIVAGTTDASQPTWPTTIGGTVVDGTVTWECKGYYTPDIEGPLVPGIGFLDQYVFVMNTKGVIYNSNVGDPTLWTPTDFISSEMRPDEGVALAVYYNYIIAYGERSIESFYDAANASGSPLARVQEAVMNIGCVNGDTVVTAENTMFFLGSDGNFGKAVYMYEGLTPDVISTKPIERRLNGVDTSSANAFYVRIAGHSFYVLRVPTASTTFVYDAVDQSWSEWNSSGSTFAYKSQATKNSICHLQSTSDGSLDKFDIGLTGDDGVAIAWEVVLDVWDGGTKQNKVMNRLEVVSDEQDAGSVTVFWSDDDGKNWTDGKTIDMSQRDFLTRLGMFQRRIFKLTGSDTSNRMRMEALEVDVEMGDYGINKTPIGF